MISARFKSLLLLAGLSLLASCESGGSASDSTDNGFNQVLASEIAEIKASLIVTQPELDWLTCEISDSLECATLMVPVDYAEPEGEVIEIALARIRQLDTTNTRRTLVINPGGPGGSGIGYLAGLSSQGQMSESLRAAYDFVSFDPRGVGDSTVVNCDLTALFQQDVYATTREEIELNVSLASSFADTCFQTHGSYLQQLGSHNVVQDLNEIRKAFGLPQLDFLGFSYGSRLAGLYMQRYPDTTGRFVLDASVSPDSGVSTLIQGGLTPAQANIDSLVDACLGFPIVCNPDAFEIALQQRVDELGAQPASAESSLLFAILQIAANQPGFEQLLIGSLSSYIESRDVSDLEFLDRILGISESAEDNGPVNNTANIAALCADDASRPTVDSLVALGQDFNAASNLLAEAYLRPASNCAGWIEALNPLPTIATNQAPASLVIGGPTDAQTPLVFAEQMAEAVGGHFLRSEHQGHTTVFTGKNACTNRVVETFLLSGQLPSFSVCVAGGAPTSTDWHDDFMQASW